MSYSLFTDLCAYVGNVFLFYIFTIPSFHIFLNFFTFFFWLYTVNGIVYKSTKIINTCITNIQVYPRNNEMLPFSLRVAPNVSEKIVINCNNVHYLCQTHSSDQIVTKIFTYSSIRDSKHINLKYITSQSCLRDTVGS